MTKEQHIKNIKSIINSPRNDEQKISMLEQSFSQYVNDTMERIVERLYELSYFNFDDRIEDYRDYFELRTDDAIEIVKEEGGISE